MNVNTSLRHTYDLPRSESGLAEWTSKIKALQRQVDDDEEQETKKLEEEIRSSRMTRIRRSTLQSRQMSVELPRIKDPNLAASPVSASEQSTENKAMDRESALRKLMGQRSPIVTESARGPSSLSQLSTASQQVIPGSAQEPVSLAAFMGSRATGPRLNRHAPQQDAHDPTQFDQPTKIAAPHPIFGRGGVAMPGMSPASKAPSKVFVAPSINTVETRSTAYPTRERRISTPSVAQKYRATVEQNKVAPPKPESLQRDRIRERTMSTPSGPGVFRNANPPKSPAIALTSDITRSAVNRSPSSHTRSFNSPVRDMPDPKTIPPSFQRQPEIHRSSPHSKSTVATPALARPAQSNPKPAFPASQIVPSNPSSAFVRSTPPKDASPSLSRLQGRGFVKSMVKVSSQIEAAATNPQQTPEKGAGAEKKKLPSVLDRWSASTSVSPAQPPAIPFKPVAMRRTSALERESSPIPNSPPAVRSLKPVSNPIAKSKSQNFTPASAQIPARSTPSPFVPSQFVRTPAAADTQMNADADGSTALTAGLGSSNTLVSYIKPMKTGDPPIPETSRPKTHARDLGEMSLPKKSPGKLWEEARKAASPAPLPTEVVSPGQPLSHPTKDRAKKPKKTKSSTVESAAYSTSPFYPTKSPSHPIPIASLPLWKPVPPSSTRTPEPEHLRNSGITSSVNLPTPPDSTSRPPLVSNNSKVADRWGNQPMLGVKPMLNGRGGPPSTVAKPERSGVGKVALPGLTTSPPASVVPKEEVEKSPKPVTPRTRIPSTGNRATVMDVAQVWSEHIKGTSTDSRPQTPPRESSPEPVEEEPPMPDVKAAIANWGFGGKALNPPSPTMPSSEKSSWEKYSAVALPALKEERSPIPTPPGTVRNGISPKPDSLEIPGGVEVKTVLHSPIDVLHTSLNPNPRVVSVNDEDLVHFDHSPEPLPKVDVEALIKAKRSASGFISDRNVQTVSVDVLSVVGNASTAVMKDENVFYENEILAIVHRFKVKTSGLMDTKVWSWLGKNSNVGEREHKTLTDLAKRYGTKLVSTKQYCEPPDLVAVLGGQLATRQGSRTYWSSDNTTMHLVRVLNGSTFIDEQNLKAQNLCSGFSYCLTILQNFYVWHGCGSLPAEQKAALAYAQDLSGNAENVIELTEGENDDDDMFWMMLGDKDYAQAQHWKWRPNTEEIYPRVWKVDSNAKEQIQSISAVSEDGRFDQNVHVLDCIWELYVLVGSEARGKKPDIRLALAAAMGISARGATSKPFTPTVHVLILPTQLPMDLRLSLRDMDEERINGGTIPEHMNILPAAQALEHLDRSSWDKGALKDKTILPLGLHEGDLS